MTKRDETPLKFLNWDFNTGLIRFVDEYYNPIPRHRAKFTPGELVEIKGDTYKVAYVNDVSVTFEPASLILQCVESDRVENER